MINFKETAINAEAGYEQKKRAEEKAREDLINKRKELVGKIVGCIERYGEAIESDWIRSIIPIESISVEIDSVGIVLDDVINILNVELKKGNEKASVDPKSFDARYIGGNIEINFKINIEDGYW